MAAPPPRRLFLRGVLMYLMPFSSNISSILAWCFLFDKLSQISDMKLISVFLSSISATNDEIFGKRDRALYIVALGSVLAKAIFSLLLI